MSINHDPSFALDHDPTTASSGVLTHLRESLGVKAAGVLVSVGLLTGASAGSCSGPAIPESKPDRSISATPKPGADYEVKKGDTLSEIVNEACPQGPKTIADMVVDVQLANRLSSPHIHAGQQLAIPDDLCAQ